MTPILKIIELYRTRNMDNVKLAIQLTKPYIENKFLLQELNLFFLNNNTFIIPLLETTWWRKLDIIKNVTQLDLYQSNLTSLPKEICELVNLDYLDLSYNFLTNLPEEIGNLTKLRKLYLTDNQLTTLPNTMSNLVNLDYVYLWRNNFNQHEKSNIKKIIPEHVKIGIS